MAEQVQWLIIHANGEIGKSFLEKMLHSQKKCIGSYYPEGKFANTLKDFHCNRLVSELDVENFHQAIEEKASDIQGLLLNLDGIPYPSIYPALTEMRFSEWNHFMDMYLKIPFLIVQERIQEWLINKTQGKIVFVLPCQSVANKHPALASIQTALISFNRSLAKEYGLKKIYSNAILPAEAGKDVENIVNTIVLLGSQASNLIDGELLKF